DSVSGDYWFHTFDYLVIADQAKKTLHSSTEDQSDHPLLRQLWKIYGNTNKIRYLLQDSYHNIWMSTWTSDLIRYNLDDHSMTIYSIKDVRRKEIGAEQGDFPVLIQAMYEDRQKNLWIATDFAGLLLYDRVKNDFNYITSDEKIHNGLRYNSSIYAIFQDREDNIWLGTDRGINVFNPYHDYFQKIRHLEGVTASIPKYTINDVIETGHGEILIASWGGGITVCDEDWNFIRNITFSGPEEYNLVWSFVMNDDGMIWAGTQQGFIHIYDPVRHTIRTIHPDEMNNTTITTMVKDHDGNILLGLHGGRIVVWNKEEQKFYKPASPSVPIAFQNSGIECIQIDKTNHCWVTSGQGLLEFDLKAHRYIHLYQPDSTDAVAGITMKGIEEYNDSFLLIGVIYRGIFAFNLNARTFSRLPALKPLGGTSIFSIKKDTDDQYWLTSNYQFYKMDPRNDQLTVYKFDHSMMNSSIEKSKITTLHDGRWVATTPAEIICFDPSIVGKNRRQDFGVAISRFSVVDHPLYIDSFLIDGTPVVLPYNKNFISIEYSSLNYMDSRETDYFYRLVGLEDNWIHSTTKQFADYTDLKPGEYVFEVKAERGIGSSPITSFQIIIRPPWWGTWWFRLMGIFVFSGAIYLLLKKRIQHIRKQSELSHRIAQTEMMALRAQMNPHFIFNCLNSIDNLIQTDQKNKATDYLAKFAQLIRAILENSKTNAIPFWKDLDALKLYLEMEALRWDNKIQYQLNIDPQIQNGDYKVPPMVIQPFVGNAIHHGLLNKIANDRKLYIEVKLEDQNIKYTISDNGVGRKEAAELKKLNNIFLKSYGIQISHERIGLFNENQNNAITITDLYDEEKEACGTRVEIWLTTQPALV
ncbi:MAG: histidine kinase, partial [Saprospiraceae bacterium]